MTDQTQELKSLVRANGAAVYFFGVHGANVCQTAETALQGSRCGAPN